MFNPMSLPSCLNNVLIMPDPVTEFSIDACCFQCKLTNNFIRQQKVSVSILAFWEMSECSPELVFVLKQSYACHRPTVSLYWTYRDEMTSVSLLGSR